MEDFANGVEDSVDEGESFFFGIAAGHFEGFVDDDGGGSSEVAHFVDGHAEDVAVDDGHAVKTPVFGAFGDEVVDFGEAGGGAPGEGFHKRVRRGRRVDVTGFVLGGIEGEVEGLDGLVDALLARVPLKQDLQGTLAGTASRRHRYS